MRPVYALGLFIPAAIVLDLAGAPDTAIFFAAAIGVIPTAALIGSHPGARPEIMPTGDGTIVVSFGPRRGNGAYVVDPEGGSRWVTTARYAAA